MNTIHYFNTNLILEKQDFYDDHFRAERKYFSENELN